MATNTTLVRGDDYQIAFTIDTDPQVASSIATARFTLRNGLEAISVGLQVLDDGTQLAGLLPRALTETLTVGLWLGDIEVTTDQNRVWTIWRDHVTVFPDATLPADRATTPTTTVTPGGQA